jgi:hypothetical protein
MNLRKIMFSIGLFSLISISAFSTTSGRQKKHKSNVAAAGLGEEKTKAPKKEMHFSDQVVNGKFQLPGESAIEVENEKPVFNLLQIRADFKDRRLKETTRD